MKCLICNSDMEYYFSKTYTGEPFATYMKDIGTVNYCKCKNCGFVFSETHSKLPSQLWEKLNLEYHHYSEMMKARRDPDRPANPSPYFQQAATINLLIKNDIIDPSPMLDFAGGYGTLSKLLQKYFGQKLYIYDPYVRQESSDYIATEDLKKYKVVVNSAMFEHIINRDTLDQLNSLVDSDGCLIIHTLVCERIPADPDWFYLKPPVHCAFHTNKSMEILMEQWGYASSIYCPVSKTWVLLKKERKNLSEKIEAVNVELQQDYLIYKKGFIDYWKGF
ncbi:hypothetical protein GGR21_002671 [Dysgonomonas hofstadii]|uniref:Methyltransferase domain-containing protein n=1 Tax=Dysgonomonas hofstadii TaxID=637886 RepID=A0A840CRI1_9BACT|nr:class I SAM-dependent methyltransferase [Dysgonomonas hofstadii]MBB4036758.1 hypothetical protein [Dysgonomonas hofstadii]